MVAARSTRDRRSLGNRWLVRIVERQEDRRWLVGPPILRGGPANHEHDQDNDADDDDRCDEHDAKYLERSFYQPFLAEASIAVDVDEPLCSTTHMRPTT